MKRFYSAIIMIPRVNFTYTQEFRGQISCAGRTKQVRFGVILTCERTFLVGLEVVEPNQNIRQIGTRFIRPSVGQEESFTHTFSFTRPEQAGYPAEFKLSIEVQPDVAEVPAYLTLSAETTPDEWVNLALLDIPEGTTWTLDQTSLAEAEAKGEEAARLRKEKATPEPEPERRILAGEPNDTGAE